MRTRRALSPRDYEASFGLAAHYHLHLDEVIPAHAGLGSGTQLALAIGSAVAVLEGLPLDLNEIAARLERGKRSGIGIGTFEQGGAVLDGGPAQASCRRCSRASPSRAAGACCSSSIRPRPACMAQRSRGLCRAAGFPRKRNRRSHQARSAGALPALAAEDFKAFCDEVGYLQKKMGAYFAPIQGGPYVSAGVAAVLNGLGDGITGLGQSSWGPTGFAFAASEAEGQGLLAAARGMDGSAKFDLSSHEADKPAVIETR